VKLEGSLETFATRPKAPLGNKYTAFHYAVDDVEAEFRVGPKYDGIVERMGGFLRRKSPVRFGDNLFGKIGTRLKIENHLDTISIYTTPPVDYVFDRAGSKRDIYAWRGLVAHGPYERPP
jgi:hypothetical protein